MPKRKLFSGPVPFLKPAVLVGSLFPFVALAIRAARGQLGANPIATGLNQLGLVALVFLVASLACTPLKLLFGWTWPIRIRRMLGLFAFFYAVAHFTVYLVLDLELNWSTLGADIAKRPYITIGFTALLLLIPLAATSTNGMMRRLGRRWTSLHRLVYVIAILGVWHFYWQVKRDVREPLIYAGILALLLLYRVVRSARARAHLASTSQISQSLRVSASD